MKKNWYIAPSPEEQDIERLTEILKCSRTTSILLLQRGINTKEDADVFFNHSLNNLHDPFLMKDMDVAVSRLNDAISNNEKILIYGDYDVDGTTSVAIIYKYLKDNYSKDKLNYYIPDRYAQGYGISTKVIDYAVKTEASLMIVADYGVKDIENVNYGKERGLDIIICDHHTPGEFIPDAVAVLNPQRNDCKYPYKWLSACGVCFKFLQGHSISNNIPIEKLYKYLDLVAVSIASDIVPATGENRILAHFGLIKLNTSPTLGLKTIMKAANVKSELSLNEIVFKIGPRINAAGRVDDGKKSVDLLVEEDEKKAKEINSYINKYNDQRKKIDQRITEEALELIKFDINQENSKTIVLFNEAWHKGVIAIVASRVTETFHKPSIILTESNGFATGSARSIDGFDLYAAISKCSDLLENYGGHKYATGLTLKIENIEAFKNKFEEIVSETIENKMLEPKMNIDANIPLTEISIDLCEDIRKFAPFGPNNNIPIFMTEKVSNFVIGTQKVGKKGEHLRLVVEDGSRACNERKGIGFSMGHLYEKLCTGKYFDIAYTIQENVFMAKKDAQMIIKDITFREDK